MTKSRIEKLTVFKTPEESPGFLLWHVSITWRSHIEKVLKPLNLTHPQFVVLATTGWLTRSDESVNQLDISKISGLDPNTVSQIFRGLETKNFIQRTRSVTERGKNPKLTDQGSKVLAKALPAVEKADARFFRSLNQEEIYILIALFQKIVSR